MKRYFNSLQSVLLLIAILIIIFQKTCSTGPFGVNTDRSKDIDTVITEKINIEWDTIYNDTIIYKPKLVYRDTTLYDTITSPVDTLAILKDYFSLNVYTDSIGLDNLGYITISDEISRNEIQNRLIRRFITLPTTTIDRNTEITREKLKHKIFIGVGVNMSPQAINYVGGELLWKNKQDQIYGLGIGLGQNFNPVIGGRMYWKIKLKK